MCRTEPRTAPTYRDGGGATNGFLSTWPDRILAANRPDFRRAPTMGVTYEEAEAQLREWTSGASLLGHARAVEAAMRRAAHRYGRGEPDETTWAITGLLHDADYERWPDEHPNLIVAWLREKGEPEIAHAVAAH